MTQDEFNELYLTLAQALGRTENPTLFRDRLLLLALRQLDSDVAHGLVERANTGRTVQ